MLLAMVNGQDDVRMTLRVSRDSGRTWSPLVEVRVGKKPLIPDGRGFPPCTCVRCARQSTIDALRAMS